MHVYICAFGVHIHISMYVCMYICIYLCMYVSCDIHVSKYKLIIKPLGQLMPSANSKNRNKML